MKKIVLDILNKNKLGLCIQTIFIGINIYLLTIPPQIIGKIINLLNDIDTNKQKIIDNAICLIIICIIILMVRMIWKYYETKNNREFEKGIKDRLFDRFLKLKIKDIENIKNGQIMSYFVKDINELRRIVWKGSSYGVRTIFTLIIVMLQMSKCSNLKLTILTMLPIFVGSFIVIKLKKYLEINFKRSQERFTKLSEYIQESTDSVRTTKAYSCEENQLKEFIKKNKKVKESDNIVDIFSNLIKISIKISFGLCYAISLIYGSKLVLDGTMTLGALVEFNGYIALFVGPVDWLPGLVTAFKRAQISYKRIEKVFELDKEQITFEKNTELQERLEGKIEIKNLSFNYPDCIINTLENININIEKGKTLGIIGTIGSGKTTLMNLITKLYDIPNGKIYIDGRDINTIPTDVVRDNICYITQDNFLFSASLKENINLFRDEYEDQKILDSTKKSVIYDEINNMENGINTIIGERGIDLSGGQKQRVVISRAFLKNSSVVIFDDTFSALDNRTSKELLDNIKDLTQDKTCIIISNKISDVKNSDKIIVLESSKIIEEGTHDELINKEGKYYEFYKQQSSKDTLGLNE